MKIDFTISDESFDLLIKIGDAGCAEYRDTNYISLEHFKERHTEFKDEEVLNSMCQSFLKRNFGGTLHLLNELISKNLIDNDNDSFHLTYVLSDFGREIYERRTSIIRDNKIENVLY